MTESDLEQRVEAYEAGLVAGKISTAELDGFLPPAGARRQKVLVELLRVTLEHEWRPGQSDGLDGYRHLYPDVFADPGLLGPLAYEEYRLRAAEGQPVKKAEYARRYGLDVSSWCELAPDECADRSGLAGEPDDVQSWREFSLCHPEAAGRMLVARRRLPNVGERFGPFRLMALLGQGAFGKVFLARQGTLADRYVALKVTAEPAVEADKLARMQHGNIVPVYSVHRRSRLTAVCMPYLGSVTLADVQQKLRSSEPLPASARSLVETVEARQAELSTIIDGRCSPALGEREERLSPSTTGALAQLASFPLAEAIAWIMARVAEGLAHAHERGIIHQDLKPANILISDDGQPLILDFNLATDAAASSGHLARLGGTLPYMSPEQLSSLQSGGRADARSDLYSLGVVFYEVLARQLPFPLRKGPLESAVAEMIRDRREIRPAPVRSLNPAVSPGLQAIVQKCLEVDPARRYASARQLHEDLQRHLANQPLLHAPDRSASERWQKWRRRHPRLSSAATVLALVGILSAGAAAVWTGREREFAQQRAQVIYREFLHELPEARSLLVIGNSRNMLQAEGIASARDALHRYSVLDDRRWYEQPQVRALSAAQRAELAEQVVELLVLLAWRQELDPSAAGPSQKWENAPSAAALTDLAVESWRALTGRPPPRALSAAAQRRGASQADFPASAGSLPDLPDASLLSATESTDLWLEAIAFLQQRNLADAVLVLQRLSRLHPQDEAVWLLLGYGHLEMGEAAQAQAEFTACIALRSDLYLGWFWRGMARAEQRQFDKAQEDFSAALSCRRALPEALFNRALARQQLHDHRGAIDDLTLAIDRDLERSCAYFSRARSEESLGNSSAASRDREEGLRRTPHDALSWIERGVAQLQVRRNPQAAAHDFEQALRFAPSARESITALMNLAHVQAEQLRRPEDGIATLSRLLELKRDESVARGSRAVLYARLGRNQEATSDVRDLLQGKPDSFGTYQAACVYALLAKDNAANRAFALQLLAQAVVLDPALRETARTDPDLNHLHAERVWQQLTSERHSTGPAISPATGEGSGGAVSTSP